MTGLCLFVFSIVVWLSRGQYDPTAPLLAALFVAWVAVTTLNRPVLAGRSIARSLVKPFEFLPWLFALLFAIKPDLIYIDPTRSGMLAWLRLLPLVAVTIAMLPWKGIRQRGFTSRAFVMIVFLIFYASVLVLSPHPQIDVFTSNDAAVGFFRHGLNPYSQTYIDIYHGHNDYRPGFLYWPMALYLQTLSKILFHDVRAILVLCWWVAALWVPRRSFLLWLTLPFLAFGFEQAWLDPALSLCAAVSFWALKRRQWIPLALAIAAAASIKQYGFVIGFFSVIWLWFERPKTETAKTVGLSALIFGAALIPFLVWAPADFLSMTITAHTGALSRPDALNFTAFWMRTTGTDFPPLAQLAMTALGFMVGVIHVIRNRSTRGTRVVAEACAMAFGFSFLFGKFGFCNYHWLLISFWLLSRSDESADANRLPS